MAIRCNDLFRLVEEFAPLELAETWDNPGLQIGDPQQEVRRVLLALEVDRNIYQEAKEKGVQAIICHHPLLFKPLKQIRSDLPHGSLIAMLLREGIVVYAAHTNLDNADRGVSTELAKKLGLQKAKVLRPVYRQGYVKLVVFVPLSHAEDVRTTMAGAGAGLIGNYSECAFIVQGTGTFKPLEGASPFTGKVGKLEHVEEVRLEMLIPENLVDRVVEAILNVHPYEEVAFDLYPLVNKGIAFGSGRVGTLPRPVKFKHFIEQVKANLELSHLRCGGEMDREIKNVAVCGGAGADFWPDALKAGADAFVTSDIGYHAARDMLSAGINFIDAGHYYTERVILPALRNFLLERFRQLNMDVEILLAIAQADPFIYI